MNHATARLEDIERVLESCRDPFDLWDLIREAGLHVYWRQPHPTLLGHCDHAVPMAKVCAECRGPNRRSGRSSVSGSAGRDELNKRLGVEEKTK